MITRLGSDGSLPQKDFSQINLVLTGANVATPFKALRTLAENVIIYAPVANAKPVKIGPTNACTYRDGLMPGDEFKIPVGPETAINLATWFAKSEDAAATLTIIYQ
ncbi:MAG: hypothetical protein WCS42_08740 [Verrucomicrobiota bacterium]